MVESTTHATKELSASLALVCKEEGEKARTGVLTHDYSLPDKTEQTIRRVRGTFLGVCLSHLSRYNGSDWTEYVFDQQGNVAQRLDTGGNVVTSSAYDGYGVESTTGTPSDPFGYNAQWGYYLDRETGLYACMFRYYDPGQGRWLNRDPIGYAGGVNVYGYCGGSPVGWSDSTGTLRVSTIIRKLFYKNGKKTLGPRISKSEAIEHRKSGGNIMVEGKDKRKVEATAKSIEDEVPGGTIHHGADDHPQTGEPYSHFQSAKSGRGNRGHTYYRFLPSMTIPGADAGDWFGGILGDCIDIVNPIGTLQDGYDVLRWLFGSRGLSDPVSSWPTETGLPYPGTAVASSPGHNPIRH